jgi:hypothetical protein
VAEAALFSADEIAFLRELNRLKVDYMIVGLSAAALQGAAVVTQDVDLWFRDLSDPRIREALQAVGGTYIPPTGSLPPMFVGKAVSLFDIVTHMHGLDGFEAERAHVIKLHVGRLKVPVLRLDRIIRSKEAIGRPKDRLVLPLLREVLTILQEEEGP